MIVNPLEMNARKISNKSLGKRLWDCRYLYILMIPALIAMAIFSYAPMYGIQIAFKDYKPLDGIWGSEWVGLSHFERIFREPTFMTVLWNTLRISILKMLICFPAGVIFALLLNEIQHTRFKKISQTISYMPHFLSWVVLAGIMKIFLALEGPINELIMMLGGEPIYFLAKSSVFVPILIISEIWKGIGWGSIIYLASIASIPTELYESADLDGADRVMKIRYITFPHILPVVSVMFILSIGGILNAGFDQIFNLYSPIVYDVADILDTYVYRVGIMDQDFSYSTAIGLFKNVVGVTLMLTVNYVTRKMSDAGV